MPSTSKDQRTQCDYPGCTTTLSSHSKMLRHREDQHEDPKKCPIPGCKHNKDKGVKRLNLLKEHLVKKHNLNPEEVTRRMNEFRRSGRRNPTSSPDQGFGRTPNTSSGAPVPNTTTASNASLPLGAFDDTATENTFEPAVQGTLITFQPNQYTSSPQIYQDNINHSLQPDFGHALSLDQVQLLSEMHQYQFAHPQDSDFGNTPLYQTSDAGQYAPPSGTYVQEDSSTAKWMNMETSLF